MKYCLILQWCNFVNSLNLAFSTFILFSIFRFAKNKIKKILSFKN